MLGTQYACMQWCRQDVVSNILYSTLYTEANPIMIREGEMVLSIDDRAIEIAISQIYVHYIALQRNIYTVSSHLSDLRRVGDLN